MLGGHADGHPPPPVEGEPVALDPVAEDDAARAQLAGRPAALYRFVSADPAWGAGRRKRVR